MDGLDQDYRTQIEQSKRNHPLPPGHEWTVLKVVSAYLKLLHQDLMQGIMSLKFAQQDGLEDYKITYM